MISLDTLLSRLLALPTVAHATTVFPADVRHVLTPPMLTDWERSFCESLVARMDEGRSVSPQQAALARQLVGKYLGEGLPT